MRPANRFQPLTTFFRNCLIGFSLAGGAQAEQLTVVIDNIQSDEGQLRIAIGGESAYVAPEGGETEPHDVQVILPAQKGSVRFVTDALPPGRYAVQVFHDENGNGELDANFVGMPKEPWGFSNNARGNFGPPKFEDTSVELNGEATITIRVEK